MMTGINSTKIKGFPCKYCGKNLSTRQSQSRHQLKRNNKCLKDEEKKVKSMSHQIPEGINDDEAKHIIRLKEQISLLENNRLTPEEREIKQLRIALENMKYRLDEQDKKLSIYEPFYVKYMLEDADTIKYYDRKKMYDHLQCIIEEKFTSKLFLMGDIGVATAIYSFFFPKYYRIVDVNKRLFKYKNEDGEIKIDIDLERLKNIVCKHLFLISHWIIKDMEKKGKLKYNTKKKK